MWKCKVCNSTEVEGLDWIDLNSGDHLNDDVGEYYCRSCQNNVDVEYEDDAINDLESGSLEPGGDQKGD